MVNYSCTNANLDIKISVWIKSGTDKDIVFAKFFSSSPPPPHSRQTLNPPQGQEGRPPWQWQHQNFILFIYLRGMGWDAYFVTGKNIFKKNCRKCLIFVFFSLWTGVKGGGKFLHDPLPLPIGFKWRRPMCQILLFSINSSVVCNFSPHSGLQMWIFKKDMVLFPP